MEEPNRFGQELRKLRKEIGYTQEQLAKLAGISTAYVSQLETGEKKPTDRVITKLSKALDIEENQLLIKVGKLKMDLFGTLSITQDEAQELLTNLSEKEWQEVLTYLAYIKVKASILLK